MQSTRTICLQLPYTSTNKRRECFQGFSYCCLHVVDDLTIAFPSSVLQQRKCHQTNRNSFFYIYCTDDDCLLKNVLHHWMRSCEVSDRCLSKQTSVGIVKEFLQSTVGILATYWYIVVLLENISEEVPGVSFTTVLKIFSAKLERQEVLVNIKGKNELGLFVL